MSWVIWIFGIVYIRMFYQYVIEKKKPEMNWPLFGVWMAMMICMVFSQFVSGRMAAAVLVCVWYFLFDELQPQRLECTVYLSGRRGDDWFFYCAGAGLDA